MAATCEQLVDRRVNFVMQSGNRVRDRLRVGVRAWCSIYNETLYKMQQIYYMHNVVYIISIFHNTLQKEWHHQPSE